VIETYSAKLPRNAGPIPSLPFAELSLGEILVCPIRAHIQDLQHFEAFRDFAESVTYAGTTPGRLPTPPASTIPSVSFAFSWQAPVCRVSKFPTLYQRWRVSSLSWVHDKKVMGHAAL
jgi:hypothetical protein